MVGLVLCDLPCVLRDDRIFERYLPTTEHRTARACAAELTLGKSYAENRILVELRLKVFQVQREIEDVDVARPGGRLADGVVAAATARRQDGTACHAGRVAAALAKEVASLSPFLGLFLQHVEGYCISKHHIS